MSKDINTTNNTNTNNNITTNTNYNNNWVGRRKVCFPQISGMLLLFIMGPVFAVVTSGFPLRGRLITIQFMSEITSCGTAVIYGYSPIVPWR